MTTGRASKLLRRPEQGRAGFLELFLDLVFVLAFFRLSQVLLEHLSWTGAFQTLVLLSAVLFVWVAATRFTDTFDPRHPLIQLVVMSIMFGTLMLAAAAPEAFGQRGLVFAGVYVVVRLGIFAVAIFLLQGQEGQRNAMRLLFWVGVSAVFWIAGAFLPGWMRGALWMTAAAVEYVGIALGFPTPRLGRSGERRLEVVVFEEHVAERFRQFFIVALGEPVVVTGLAFANAGFGAASSAATLVAFVTTALLWRIYIHRAGALIAEAIAAAPNRLRVGVLTLYSHVIMIAGIVTIAVADELLITHPLGHTNLAWLPVILGGPALFLAGRAIFEYAVFGRVSRPRVIGALTLLVTALAMALVPPLAVATTGAFILAVVATFILFGIAVSDVARARRRPSERPSPPR